MPLEISTCSRGLIGGGGTTSAAIEEQTGAAEAMKKEEPPYSSSRPPRHGRLRPSYGECAPAGYLQLLMRTHDGLDIDRGGAVRDFMKRERTGHVFIAAASVGGIQSQQHAARRTFCMRTWRSRPDLIRLRTRPASRGEVPGIKTASIAADGPSRSARTPADGATRADKRDVTRSQDRGPEAVRAFNGNTAIATCA